MLNMIQKELHAHHETISKTIETMIPSIQNASELMVKILKSGNKVLLVGNGGSAADAQHIAAELTGRYKSERRGLPARQRRKPLVGPACPPSRAAQARLKMK